MEGEEEVWRTKRGHLKSIIDAVVVVLQTLAVVVVSDLSSVIAAVEAFTQEDGQDYSTET